MPTKRGRKPEGEETLKPLSVWLPPKVIEWLRTKGPAGRAARERIVRGYEEESGSKPQ